MQVSSSGNFSFTNDLMTFRYLNILCPFYTPKGSKFTFDLEISSVPEKAKNWKDRAKNAIDQIQNNDKIPKLDISGLLEGQPNATQSFVLEADQPKAFLLQNLQQINISCALEVVHSIYVVRGEKKIIWVEEVESTINYDFKEEFDLILVLFIAGKADQNYEFKLATLDLLLQLNLDTSVDQATSLLGNFIGVVLIGLYNIIRKLREHCAKKKKIRNSSLPTTHIQFNETHQQKIEGQFNGEQQLKNYDSRQNSDFEFTNSKSNSISESNQSDNLVINQHYNLPEAFRQR